MYKIDYTYLEDCDGGYSKAIDKIETVAQVMNNTGEFISIKTLLLILGIVNEEEEECEKNL